MPGHLFIVQADLTRLACDAWLLPTGRGLQIRNHWLRGAPPEVFRVLTQSDRPEDNQAQSRHTWVFAGRLKTPDGWEERRARTFDMLEWSTKDRADRPWPTQIVVRLDWTPERKAEWIAEGADQFVRSAAAALRGRRPSYGRHRHLLALPVVGTGHGGGRHEAGTILRHLVQTLDATTRDIDADVALVTYTRDQLAAAQHARREVIGAKAADDPWSVLSDELQGLGQILADRSVHGRLVLFLGAGVSMSAELPAWDGLLAGLANDAGFDEESRAALAKLPAVDQARLIRDRMASDRASSTSDTSLADAICGRVNADRYGLTHSLLASLNVSETVTTNYDTLFEMASHDAGHATAILPYESPEGMDRWLLKMHGCVTQPDDIVLTREDYLRYAERRGALAAIVQALLITRHMLFVGFSLNDDNFQRIADEVRKVVRSRPFVEGQKSSPFGTALLLNPQPLFARLWADDVACVAINGTSETDSEGSTQPSTGGAANVLEVLLDYILFRANQHVNHILDDRYAGVLNPAEEGLKASIVNFERSVSPEMTQLPAWKPVADMLRALGRDTMPRE